MSRDYDIYCKNCDTYKARKGFIKETSEKKFYLNQCLGCGRVWVEIRTQKELFVGIGSTEKKKEQDWKRGITMVWNKK